MHHRVIDNCFNSLYFSFWIENTKLWRAFEQDKANNHYNYLSSSTYTDPWAMSVHATEQYDKLDFRGYHMLS